MGISFTSKFFIGGMGWVKISGKDTERIAGDIGALREVSVLFQPDSSGLRFL